jgi:leucyl aminopeptidase (aminopeptidase T)
LIQPVLTDLTKTTFDAELSPGAHNAVHTCLRIQPWEKVTLITDNACRDIAASIAQELLQVGSPFKAFVLEDLAPRPLVELPPEIAADMETSQVSIFAVISPDKWGNLPGGEVFTTPGEVNGTYVVDGVVGDYLCEKYPDLARQPLTIQMRNNRITEVFSDNKVLEEEFWAYTHTDENSHLVGEFAIGTNLELKHVIGQILQDEKFPGLHIAFGNPYGAHTGAEWYSSTHIDVVGTRFDIWVDGQQIMDKGRFLIEA